MPPPLGPELCRAALEEDPGTVTEPIQERERRGFRLGWILAACGNPIGIGSLAGPRTLLDGAGSRE